MQRLFSIPLLILYLVVSIGIQGVHHFCEGDLVEVALFGDNERMSCDEMSCCDTPEPSDEACCTDVQFVVFYESERSLTMTSNSLEFKAPMQAIVPFSLLIQEEAEDWAPPSIQLQKPESVSSVPIYLQHHSLIFYG